jgi:hypothetical protein
MFWKTKTDEERTQETAKEILQSLSKGATGAVKAYKGYIDGGGDAAKLKAVCALDDYTWGGIVAVATGELIKEGFYLPNTQRNILMRFPAEIQAKLFDLEIPCIALNGKEKTICFRKVPSPRDLLTVFDGINIRSIAEQKRNWNASQKRKSAKHLPSLGRCFWRGGYFVVPVKELNVAGTKELKFTIHQLKEIITNYEK